MTEEKQASKPQSTPPTSGGKPTTKGGDKPQVTHPTSGGRAATYSEYERDVSTFEQDS